MKKDVGKYYNEWTQHYLQSGYGDIIQAHRPADVTELLDYTIEQAGIKDGLKILDAGCGVCGPAIYIAERFNVEIHAISISVEQIKIANQKIKDQKLEDRIHTHLLDFHKINEIFENESFDLVMMLESFGHARNHKQVLKVATDSLKKEGHLYIKDYFKKELTGSRKRKSEIKRIIRNMNLAYTYNLPDLSKCMQTLRKLDMELIRMNKNQLKLDNEASVLQFEKDHGIDLYKGKTYRRFLDPLELYFRKPTHPDEPIR